MLTGLLLLLIGLFAGTFGIMVGAGGGFVFVPALLILVSMSPATATATGLVVVFINSVSGVFGYVRQKRIHYKMGIILAIGATPGTFFGIWLTHVVSSNSFYWIFAGLLIALGLFLWIKNTPKENPETKMAIAASLDGEAGQGQKKIIVLLFLIGILLGVVSSFFGIGGGFLLVPILIYIFRMAPHYATATSIFSLCLYSAVGVLVHIVQGNIDWMAVACGGLGILGGAQLGVYLSNKISGKRITQILSVLLMIVGIKLFF